MNVLELKYNIKPKELAVRFIGEPRRKVGQRWWYNSPFRQETQPSFVVSDKGFHDFGDNWTGDIIDFTQRIFGIDFKQAVEYLKRMYGFTDSEYETPKIKHIKQLQMKQRQEKELKVAEWYNRIYGYLCNIWQQWEDIVKEFKPLSYEYAYAQNKIFIYDYWIDYFIENQNTKEKIYDERDDIEWKIKYQKHFTTN
jgi:hypothetical protein